MIEILEKLVNMGILETWNNEYHLSMSAYGNLHDAYNHFKTVRHYDYDEALDSAIIIIVASAKFIITENEVHDFLNVLRPIAEKQVIQWNLVN